jgi:putative aldouronate transport system substrate-binding protein
MLKKRLITLGLIAAIISTLMAGCSKEGTNKKDNEKIKDTTQTTNTVEFTGYPMETEESLSIWASQLIPSQTVGSWEESPFHTGLSEQTGIYMDWTFPTSGTDANQAFNLMMAESELPDIIWHGVINDAETYIEEGILRDLTDLLPKYAPNYWKYLKENEYADKSVKTDSGKYYCFGFFREDRSQSVYMGPMIRQDWLEAQNLDIPITTADWENAIRAFNKAYGAKFAFCPTWRVSPGMAGAFGAYGTIEMALFIDKDNKVQLAQAQPEWKEYMTWLNQLNKEGLIDPDVITLDDSGLRTKIANNQVGITNANLGALNTFIEDAAANDNGANWVGVPYPVKNPGDKTSAIFSEDQMVGAVAAITTSCPEEKVELALRWLDYSFSEEGNYYWNFGVEGDTYEMINGVPTLTDKIKKHELGMREAMGLHTGQTGWGIGIQALQMIKQTSLPESEAARALWYDGTNQAATSWIYPTAVTMTPDETTESSSISNAISTYVKEMSLKFLTGEESLDNFDAFVQTLNDMGLERLLEIRQAAYDRFLTR